MASDIDDAVDFDSDAHSYNNGLRGRQIIVYLLLLL